MNHDRTAQELQMLWQSYLASGDGEGLLSFIESHSEVTRPCGHPFPQSHRIQDIQLLGQRFRVVRCVLCEEKLTFSKIEERTYTDTPGVPYSLHGEELKRWADQADKPKKSPIMTTDTLVKEGRALARPSTFLTKEPLGPVAARWYPPNYDDYNKTRVHCWLTVDARHIPGYCSQEPTFLTLFSHEGRQDDGRVEITKAWPREDGIPLYAHPVSVLPPIDAVFALGSPAIDVWLSSYRCKRTDNFLSSLKDVAVQEYEKLWEAESPYFLSEVYAVLGGWHMPWPEGDFKELLQDQLLIWTLQDPEPWVELWRKSSGEFRVVQRIS